VPHGLVGGVQNEVAVALDLGTDHILAFSIRRPDRVAARCQDQVPVVLQRQGVCPVARGKRFTLDNLLSSGERVSHCIPSIVIAARAEKPPGVAQLHDEAQLTDLGSGMGAFGSL
jgi:hypothetical protein